MRIVCPECGARYDIPDAAIPAPGRDVQCAVCTNAWYQLGGGSSRPAETAARPAGPVKEDDADIPTADMPPPRREVDPEVLRILREEAAFETARRDRDRDAPAERSTPSPNAAVTDASEQDSSDARPMPRGPELENASPLASAEGPAEAGAPVAARGPALRDSRLARLAAAESDAPPLGSPPDTEAAVEGPVRDDATPPLLARGDMAAALTRAKAPADKPRNLPARITPADRALTLQAQRRRGFRLGFAGTAGLVCAVLLIYLAAPHVAERLPQGTPFAETVVAHGDRVQAAIVELVRTHAAPSPGQ